MNRIPCMHSTYKLHKPKPVYEMHNGFVFRSPLYKWVDFLSSALVSVSLIITGKWKRIQIFPLKVCGYVFQNTFHSPIVFIHRGIGVRRHIQSTTGKIFFFFFFFFFSTQQWLIYDEMEQWLVYRETKQWLTNPLHTVVEISDKTIFVYIETKQCLIFNETKP